MNMESTGIQNHLSSFFKWIVICLLTGILSGLASALFLFLLEWATSYRENNYWIISLLPIGGLMIGLLYYYYGKEAVKGNNLILEEYDNPKKTIPFIMAPLVLAGTIITHLFGGSAGREGTAVQMGGALSDQFTLLFKLQPEERKTILIIGISAGFASIFGTPLAGALFALEVLYFSKIRINSIVPSFMTAYIAYYTVELLPVKHTHYSIPFVPELTAMNLFWIVPAGILFGLAAMLFSRTTHFWGRLFSKYIPYPPLRPFVGGIILAIVIFSCHTTKFIGLGIPAIVDSFQNQSDNFDFLLKILFTGFTLGAGFKGGEVTPLFFVGATLGSALSGLIPLPVALLAGMGFVAVFSGATHTPVACSIMGMELFGADCGIYVALACLVAYFCSGSVGIYHSQIVKGPKHIVYQKIRRKDLKDL
jgi:H+/Cl- antiporter ClcA